MTNPAAIESHLVAIEMIAAAMERAGLYDAAEQARLVVFHQRAANAAMVACVDTMPAEVRQALMNNTDDFPEIISLYRKEHPVD